MVLIEKLYVLIVTYGERESLLKEVLLSLDAQKVSNVLVIGNGIKKADYKSIETLKLNLNLDFRFFDKNTGSAGGYKKGLEILFDNKNCEYILLLDDDNKLGDGALAKYLYHWNLIKERNNFNIFCILGYREERCELSRLINGENVKNVYPKNSFLGFNFSTHFSKSKVLSTSPIVIPYAPYGGMFFSKGILEQIGFPKEEFYLYSDDHEFSVRITDNGGQIILVPDIEVIECEKAWFLIEKRTAIQNYLFGDPKRVYYQVRNRVYFERNYLVKNYLVYAINIAIFLTLLTAQALFKKKSNLKVFYSAFIKGFGNISKFNL